MKRDRLQMYVSVTDPKCTGKNAVKIAKLSENASR